MTPVREQVCPWESTEPEPESDTLSKKPDNQAVVLREWLSPWVLEHGTSARSLMSSQRNQIKKNGPNISHHTLPYSPYP